MPALEPDAIDTPETLRDRYAERTRTICNDCGARADPPGTVVAAFPRPWRRHVDGRVLCVDCWSGEAAAETALAREQATVLALDALGFDDGEIATATDADPETVRENRDEIDRLRREPDGPPAELLEAL